MTQIGLLKRGIIWPMKLRRWNKTRCCSSKFLFGNQFHFASGSFFSHPDFIWASTGKSSIFLFYQIWPSGKQGFFFPPAISWQKGLQGIFFLTWPGLGHLTYRSVWGLDPDWKEWPILFRVIRLLLELWSRVTLPELLRLRGRRDSSQGKQVL